jgi:hypothetical protein
MRHNIEVVIDRLAAGPKLRTRLAEAVEMALKLGEGNLIVAHEDGGEMKDESRGIRDERKGMKDDSDPSSLIPHLSPLLPPTSAFPPTTPARIAKRAFSRRAHNSSASIARKACARSAVGWGRSIPSIPSD